MPRRPAPSALRLHKGPTPRGQPKHTIPAPPPPTLVRPSVGLHRRDAQPITTIESMTMHSQPFAIMTHQYPSTLSLPSLSPSRKSKDSSAIVPPWDRTRSFSFSAEDQNAQPPITPPKPALSNSIPIWAL